MNWKSLAGIGIGALFLYLALRGTDLSGMGTVLAGTSPVYILLIVVTVLVNMWLRAARWGYMLRRDHAIPVYRLFKIVMIGFMANNVLPARLGELVRAHALGSRENVSRTFALASIVLERMLDAFAIVFIMVCVFALTAMAGVSLPGWVAKSGGILTLVLVVMAVGLALLRFRFALLMRITDRCLRLVVRKESSRDRLEGIIKSFFDGLSLIRSWQDILVTWAYSISVWITIIVMCELSIRALGITGLPVYASSVATFLLVLGVMVPGAPGFVGTIQYFMAMSLGLFGVAKAEAVSVSVIYHASQFVPVTLIGLIYYWSGHVSLKGTAAAPTEVK